MQKRVLLVGYNFSPEPTGIGKYSGEMIQWLGTQGYDCSVITAYPYYPYWKVQEPYYKKRFWYSKEVEHFESGGKITVYRCPMYVPEEPTGKKRILSDFSFFVSALLQLVKLFFHKRYDALVTVVPSFQFGLLGCFYKAFRKTILVYHIQDLQIEAAQDLGMITSKKILSILFRVERYIFRRSDVVSSISEGMIAKIEKKTDKKVFQFPNWTSTDLFFPIQDKALLKKEFGFREDDKTILYSGAIGEKQGLEAIIYTAKKFVDKENVKFLICGSGPYKAKLEALVQQENLKNVIFFPLQPFDKFNQFLNMADMHLVIQKAKASDLVMPSKLTTILSVGGLALITANPDSSLYQLVDKYTMGILVAAENQEALDLGMNEVLFLEKHQGIKENARKYAETYLDINSIMRSFENKILK